MENKKKTKQEKTKQDKTPVNWVMQNAFAEAKAKKNGTYQHPKRNFNGDCIANHLSQLKQVEAKARRELQKAQARGGEPEYEMVNGMFKFVGTKKPKADKADTPTEKTPDEAKEVA